MNAMNKVFKAPVGRAALKKLSALTLLLGVLAPLHAHAWWNHDWAYRKAITLDTSPKGANIQSDQDAVPIVIKLHDGVLKFTDANQDGSDLRFVDGDDKTPLKFHIEKFDSVFNLAYVWVAVPKLKANGTQTVWMYYGNPKAVAGDDARGTYDPDQIAVYHFGERGAAPRDTTQFKNDLSGVVAGEESGRIGNAIKLDGKSALTLPAASSSLPVSAGAARTLSLWIKPATAAQTAVLFTQGDASNSLTLGLNAGAPYVAVVGNGVAQRAASSNALDTAAHHLAVVANGGQLNLYVDGIPAATAQVSLPAIGAVGFVGAQAVTAAAPGSPLPGAFQGEVDELEIAKSARAADYLKVLAVNEGNNDTLAAFGADEAQSTWSSGYFGIILKSVTVDGWVVIGILGVMAVISWIVMIGKGRQVGVVTKANQQFIEQFEVARGDFDALERNTRNLPASPLTRIFAVVIKEVSHRAAARSVSGAVSINTVPLSSPALEAIRASLDAVMAREMSTLNRYMVLLTIAISGGPFLGLLGTVVGVMITFAAIAAAGDVNVNAIAPGIAAALVATVAGLAVAIPALFGYNYLLAQVKDTTTEMQVFVDALITRLAETAADAESRHSRTHAA